MIKSLNLQNAIALIKKNVDYYDMYMTKNTDLKVYMNKYFIQQHFLNQIDNMDTRSDLGR